MDFAIGDYVEIVCHDGAVFKGVLQDFTRYYFILNGCGFPFEDVRVMSHA